MTTNNLKAFFGWRWRRTNACPESSALNQLIIRLSYVKYHSLSQRIFLRSVTLFILSSFYMHTLQQPQ